MGKKELDITADILKIVDEKIKKIKFDQHVYKTI